MPSAKVIMESKLSKEDDFLNALEFPDDGLSYFDVDKLDPSTRARDRNSGARCAPADRTARLAPTGPLFSGRSPRSKVLYVIFSIFKVVRRRRRPHTIRPSDQYGIRYLKNCGIIPFTRLDCLVDMVAADVLSYQ